MAYQPNPNQIPDKSILDAYYRQTYLGNAYIATVASSLSDTSEHGLILIENPAVSQLPGKAIFVNLRRFSSSAEQVLIKTYINPTVNSTSTAYVPNNLRPASPNTSISATYAAGQFSTSANGTLISAIGCAADDYVVQDNQLLVILDPGQSLLITATALADTTSLDADISWYEI